MFIQPISSILFLKKVCNTFFFQQLKKIPNLSEGELHKLHQQEKVAKKYHATLAPYLFRLEQHSKMLNDMIRRLAASMTPQSKTRSTLAKEASASYEQFTLLLAEQVRNILLSHIYFDLHHQFEKQYKAIDSSNLATFIKSSEFVILHWSITPDPLYHALIPNINQISTLYGNDLKVGEVKGKNSAILASQYHITHIPSLSFFHDGKLKKNVTGYQSLEALQAIIKTILNEQG